MLPWGLHTITGTNSCSLIQLTGLSRVEPCGHATLGLGPETG